MERSVNAMSDAYDDFVTAAADVVHAAEDTGGRRTAATAAALQNFKDRWELLRATCDRAEEVVDTARRRIASEQFVDAAGPADAPARNGGMAPVSMPSLERVKETIRWLEAEMTATAKETETETTATATKEAETVMAAVATETTAATAP